VPAAPARSLAADPTADDAHGYGWVVGVWVIVAVFGVVTAIWSEHVGIPLRDPEGKMFRRRLTTALVIMALLAVVDASVRARRGGGLTPRRAIAELRSRWPKERLALAVSGLVAYHLVYICYRNLKSWDAFNTLRDDALVDFDRWLFLGHSPAVLLHDLLGQHAAAYALAVVYKSFTYLVPLSLVSALVFTDRIRDGYVFLSSAMWLWILGVGAYYLIPSIGPFWSAAGDFAGLPHTTITSTQEEYLTERAHLLQHPEAGDAFASLSAFASLHTAFTFLVVLMLYYYGRKRLATVVAVYLVAVMVATIYFGWHFVSDDIAGLALAALAVYLGHTMTYPRGRPPRVAAGQPAS
jgi:membrane-associated phospholipid phosphatase/predicted outer membrane lipoprotein